MFARLRSLFPALALGLAALEQKAPPEAWRLSYPQPLEPRRQKSFAAGISPAVAGPHSEPQVHVRSRTGTHYWFTQDQWDIVRSAKVPFRPIAGDVIERVDGYGAVTKRERVPL